MSCKLNCLRFTFTSAFESALDCGYNQNTKSCLWLDLCSFGGLATVRLAWARSLHLHITALAPYCTCTLLHVHITALAQPFTAPCEKSTTTCQQLGVPTQHKIDNTTLNNTNFGVPPQHRIDHQQTTQRWGEGWTGACAQLKTLSRNRAASRLTASQKLTCIIFGREMSSKALSFNLGHWGHSCVHMCHYHVYQMCTFLNAGTYSV